MRNRCKQWAFPLWYRRRGLLYTTPLALRSPRVRVRGNDTLSTFGHDLLPDQFPTSQASGGKGALAPLHPHQGAPGPSRTNIGRPPIGECPAPEEAALDAVSTISPSMEHHARPQRNVDRAFLKLRRDPLIVPILGEGHPDQQRIAFFPPQTPARRCIAAEAFRSAKMWCARSRIAGVIPAARRRLVRFEPLRMVGHRRTADVQSASVNAPSSANADVDARNRNVGFISRIAHPPWMLHPQRLVPAAPPPS